MKFSKSLRLQIGFVFIAVFLLNTSSGTAFTFAPTHAKEIKTDSVIKILAIGNSFSEDALEHYLYGLAKAGGHQIIIGNLYIGGAELDLHWKNANENKEAYSYRKIGLNGEKVTTTNTSIASALADERWDYISFQQASPKSGLYPTYTTPLPALISYVKENVKNPSTKYVLHQTWAYAQTTQHQGFANYGSIQKNMYNAITKTTKKISKENKMDLLIPSGTAVQNARTSFVGDNLNVADGYHLAVMGKYTSSCTWYEKIFKESVIGNTFHPKELSIYQTDMLQNAAHAAVLKPFRVTILKNFKKTP